MVGRRMKIRNAKTYIPKLTLSFSYLSQDLFIWEDQEGSIC